MTALRGHGGRDAWPVGSASQLVHTQRLTYDACSGGGGGKPNNDTEKKEHHILNRGWASTWRGLSISSKGLDVSVRPDAFWTLFLSTLFSAGSCRFIYPTIDLIFASTRPGPRCPLCHSSVRLSSPHIYSGPGHISAYL